MSDRNHFQGVLLVARELVRAGASVRFWTDLAFRSEIERAGIEFADLFAGRPLASIDNSSVPLPARFVTFAASEARRLAAEVKAWGADLVVHDGFALVGRLVGELLAIPWITVLPGVSVNAAEARAAFATDPRLALDPRCVRAAQILREEFGIADASPHWYVGDPSPWLNIVKQPPQWLDDDEAGNVRPFACFGCLTSAPVRREPVLRDGLHVYVSFGTIVWRYWPSLALGAMSAIAAATATMPGVRLTVGLGGSGRDSPGLALPHVTVLPYADQHEVLARTDLFVTHQGLSSTHEAIAELVPMLSFPFFADQPLLGRKAQAFGVALPMGGEGAALDGTLTQVEAGLAIQAARDLRPSLHDSLKTAQEWEFAVMAGRPAVARRICDLA